MCPYGKGTLPYKQKIWLEKMLAIWKINSFSKLNLMITQDSGIIFIIIQKHNELNLANFTNKLMYFSI